MTELEVPTCARCHERPAGGTYEVQVGAEVQRWPLCKPCRIDLLDEALGFDPGDEIDSIWPPVTP